MALHHRPEIADMRFEYGHAKAGETRNFSRFYRENMDDFRENRAIGGRASGQTSEPTPTRSARNSQHYGYQHEHSTPSKHFFNDRPPEESPRSSIASVMESSDDIEGLDSEPQQYDIARDVSDSSKPSAIPASPSDFSKLFPSKRKLDVRHDDATLDGNMNLRIDTEVIIDGRRCDMTLFHLRMHDLKHREFSLRRYCRDSGREVCHSSLKQDKSSPEKRPSFQRSLSSALSNMRSKSDSKALPFADLKRSDSGYGSMNSVDFEEDRRPRSAGQQPQSRPSLSPNVVQLEFSNYAHLDVRRVGGRLTRGYAFEYWGVKYLWKRRKDRDVNEVFFYLTKTGSNEALGYIRPVPLSAEEAEAEARVGGWIPPCSLWIEDESIVQAQKDVSDVVVAAGLIALVDDSIRTHFLRKGSKPLRASLSRTNSGHESLRPKRLLSGLLHRRGSSAGHDRRLSTEGKRLSGGIGALHFPTFNRDWS